MLELSFRTPYLSIQDFPKITLPPFTVLTGKNGSGKSHLLSAIEGGQIACAVDGQPIQSNQGHIRSYNWATLVPQETAVYSSEQSKTDRQNAWNQVQSHLNQFILQQVRLMANQRGLAIISDHHLLHHTFEQFPTEYQVPALRDLIAHRENMLNQQRQQYQGNAGFLDLVAIATRKGKSPFALTQEEVQSTGLANYGSTNLFQQSFSRLFGTYRDLRLENYIQELRFRDGETDEPSLSKAAFRETYGQPPWEFVNESLQRAGLDFAISEPPANSSGPFTPKIKKITTGTDIQFSQLSSGEKVLMSFAFCIYYATDKRQLTGYPKLLLLDEVDAPLHPSMTAGMIRTIQDVLVEQCGIHVILATHSPSTLALSPDLSVHVMVGLRDGMQKTTRSESLNLLTSGVPTLALSFSGRRQVFVESNSDAETYSLLYQVIKKEINSERSLDFISTGMKDNKGSDLNTGCDLVKKVVDELRVSGNQSVFGIVDWDGKNNADQRVFVLAEGRRDGLENLLFDPLLICSIICRDFAGSKALVGIPADMSYREFMAKDALELQTYVTKCCEHVLGSQATTNIIAEYANGMTLTIDKRYMEMDDHKLHDTILAVFPALHALHKQQAGRMMQQIIQLVLLDYPAFVPIEAKNLFENLLSAPSH